MNELVFQSFVWVLKYFQTINNDVRFLYKLHCINAFIIYISRYTYMLTYILQLFLLFFLKSRIFLWNITKHFNENCLLSCLPIILLPHSNLTYLLNIKTK